MTADSGPRDPRAVRTCARVVEAAAAVLAETGFEQITVDAVAERAGVARSTIYRHWPERATLWLEAFERLCPPLESPATGSLATDLARLADRLADGLWNDTWGRIAPSLASAAQRDPDLADRARLFGDARRTLVTGVMRAARQRGEIAADDTAIEAAGVAFAGSFFYLRLLGHPFPDRDRRQALVEHTVRSLAST